MREEKLTVQVRRDRLLLSSRTDVGTIPNVLAPMTVPSRAKPVPFLLSTRHIIRRYCGSGASGGRIRVSHLRRGWNDGSGKRAIIVVS